MQRRKAQSRFRLQDQITKMIEMKKQEIKTSGAPSRPPYPRTPHHQQQTTAKFDDPNISTITTDQLNAFHEHNNEQSSSSHQEAYEMSDDDKHNFATLSQMLLKSVDGEAIDLATPIIAHAATKSQDMIVDFGEDAGNLIPIHPEFEEPLVPEDYDAYGGGHLNW